MMRGGVIITLSLALMSGGCSKSPPEEPAETGAKTAQPEAVQADTGAAGGDKASSGGMTEKEKAQKEPYPNDFGPKEIDVSSYPPEMQAKYKTFQQCSNCHVISRPINTQFHDKDTWKRYVKRMIRKPGCGISNKDGKAIYEFLVYDSQKRKISRKVQWKAHRLKLLKKFKKEHPDRYTLLFEDRSPEAEAEKQLPGW